MILFSVWFLHNLHQQKINLFVSQLALFAGANRKWKWIWRWKNKWSNCSSWKGTFVYL